MDNFQYYNPVIVCFGGDSIGKAGEFAARYGKHALLVSYTDTSFYGDLMERIRASLVRHHVSCTEFFGVTANPTLMQARAGIALAKETKADIIIGIGGGSAMDCAKVIAAGVCYDHPLERMIAFRHRSDGYQIPPTSALPTIMIPTLPATGSEMNPTAVITDEKTSHKSYVWSPDCLYPKVALVDPALSVTLPPYQTACAALDTIAHILEGYFNGTAGNLTLQDRMQEGVVKAVLETLPTVLRDPHDIQARGVMQWASAIALNGWVLSGTYGWAPMHQMGHAVSGRTNATHGATLALMMVAWLRFFDSREDNKRYVQLAKLIFGGTPSQAAAELESIMERTGMQTSLKAVGVTEDMLDLLTEDVVTVSFSDDGMLGSNPRLNKEDVRSIYKLAFK